MKRQARRVVRAVVRMADAAFNVLPRLGDYVCSTMAKAGGEMANGMMKIGLHDGCP